MINKELEKNEKNILINDDYLSTELNNIKLQIEKIILVKIPTKIYCELRKIFVFLFENSGFKDIKINETVDFEKLYKLRKA